MDRTVVTAPMPAGLTVVVLGRAGTSLVRALWGAGLRPVRGQRYGTVWALPEGEAIR